MCSVVRSNIYLLFGTHTFPYDQLKKMKNEEYKNKVKIVQENILFMLFDGLRWKIELIFPQHACALFTRTLAFLVSVVFSLGEKEKLPILLKLDIS